MSIPIFLSRPNPVTPDQTQFLQILEEHVLTSGLLPKTLGVNEYGGDPPLATVRMLMSESNGLVVVALRRYRADPLFRLRHNLDDDVMSQVYLTSPWCHIEPGMAFQLGLPMLIIRERGVLDDGILDRGVAGHYVPEIDVEGSPDAFLLGAEWRSLLQDFSAQARAFRRKRGQPS